MSAIEVLTAQDEIRFKISNDRDASVYHLDNPKLKRLAEKVTRKTKNYYYPIRECDWHLTSVLATTVRNKPIYLIYNPTEHTYWIMQNIRAGTVGDTFRAVAAVAYDNRVYLAHEWVPCESPDMLKLVWNRKAAILAWSTLTDEDPSMVALLGTMPTGQDNPLTRIWW